MDISELMGGTPSLVFSQLESHSVSAEMRPIFALKYQLKFVTDLKSKAVRSQKISGV